MANGNTCSKYAQVNGKDSKMYIELLESGIPRPVVNYIYSDFVASDTAQKMKDAGYVPNSQGEFSARDLLKFINYRNSTEREVSNVLQESINYDIIDINRVPINYTDAKTALNKAKKFNDNHRGLVATVYQYSNIFNVQVSQKNALTHMQPTEVEEKLKAWDMLKTEFAQKLNVDIDTLPQKTNTILSANNITNGINNLINIKNGSFRFITPNEALLLFSLYQNSPEVQNLLRPNVFNSLEEAANAVDQLRQGQQFNLAQRTYLQQAVESSQKFNGIDLQNLQDQARQIAADVRTNNPEQEIELVLHKLKKESKIEINELALIGEQISTLSEAAANAIIQLQRQKRALEKQQGKTAEGKRIDELMNQIMTELKAKTYVSGLLNFLKDAQKAQVEIDNLLHQVPQGTTQFEKIVDRANKLADIYDLMDRYYIVVDALADDALKMDGRISKIDIDKLKAAAKALKEYYKSVDAALHSKNGIESTLMTDILLEYLGDEVPNGLTITNLVEMARKDTSMIDHVYSVGRSSNTVLAVMGTIINEAHEESRMILQEFAKRIRRETYKLYKKHKNSKFIYEPDNIHLVSDIDWDAYYTALKKNRDYLAKKLNLKGYDFRMADEEWIEANTEERIVDNRDGVKRKERVPNSKYRKAEDFQEGWTDAQKEYYKNMMQIKGEIGTLLPEFAQDYYLAPQVRRSMLDALQDAKNARDVIKALGKKGANLWTVREDNPDYNKTGQVIIEGEEYDSYYGDYNNVEGREIPIHYVPKLKDKEELLKNFSTGLQHLASTAANYTTMNKILNLVEFMGNYEKSKKTMSNNKAEVVRSNDMEISKPLYDLAKATQTTALVDGWTAQHMFGVKKSPKENEKFRQLVDNLIGYGSFRALSTNVKGMLNNALVGEWQMMQEAGAGEFYGPWDYIWAHTRLFGTAGVLGDFMQLATNNVRHKAVLMREVFDPVQEEFDDKSRQKYYHSWFRILLSHDCSFIGYALGEYLIHFINMYAILHHEKAFINGKKTTLYNVFKVGKKIDGNRDLVIKNGATQAIKDEDGNWIDTKIPIEEGDYLFNIKRLIEYVNDSTHGAMDLKDRGILQQKWYGAAALNFRQWMIEHYSNRFRGEHFEWTLRKVRSGSWNTVFKQGFFNKNNKIRETWEDKHFAKSIMYFFRDLVMFSLRAQSQWPNLTEQQRYNVKRAHSGMVMYLLLVGLNFCVGEPDDYKNRLWRRMLIYQIKRLQMEAETSMPHPRMLQSFLTILQSPMAGVSLLNSIMYLFFGLDDLILMKRVENGPHAGELKYWRNVKKYVLPVFKDWEQLQDMDTSDAVFTIFDDTPSGSR